MANFAYRASLEKARKAVLDRKGQFAAPEPNEQVKVQEEGLMRPRARPEPASEGGMASGIGLALMEALAEKDEEKRKEGVADVAPESSARPKARGGDEIYEGLVSRGLPTHIAKGFIMNFRDESGLDTGVNEANPLVKGSRGGFGLYQVTGPRRVAYEEYAKAQGKPVDSLDAQLDFLIKELGSTESSASKKIMATKTPGEAAAVIVRSFLRPSEEHRERRANRYLSQGL